MERERLELSPTDLDRLSREIIATIAVPLVATTSRLADFTASASQSAYVPSLNSLLIASGVLVVHPLPSKTRTPLARGTKKPKRKFEANAQAQMCWKLMWPELPCLEQSSQRNDLTSLHLSESQAGKINLPANNQSSLPAHPPSPAASRYGGTVFPCNTGLCSPGASS